MPDLNRDPDFLLYYARVLMREARARRGTPFATSLVQWAGRARREAMELRAAVSDEPAQMELFGG